MKSLNVNPLSLNRLGASRAALLALSALTLSACATGPYANSADPLEPLNRKVYAFNEVVDEAVAKPVAKAYQSAIPSPVRTGVGNFFGNLGDLWSSFNALLQWEPEHAVTDFMRFTVNTVFGVYGVIDLASAMQMPRSQHSLGQTLGVWGVPAGAYVVLPLLGPSTVRDVGAGILSSGVVDPDHEVNWLQVSEGAAPTAMLNIGHATTKTSVSLVQVVDKRASLLEVTDALGGLALDPYSFVRDAYLQRQAHKINPGQ
jgi:phospholipid-binding lipoprotein MlaA